MHSFKCKSSFGNKSFLNGSKEKFPFGPSFVFGEGQTRHNTKRLTFFLPSFLPFIEEIIKCTSPTSVVP